MIPLIMSVLYVWAQLNRDMIVSFWFGTRFKVSQVIGKVSAWNMLTKGMRDKIEVFSPIKGYPMLSWRYILLEMQQRQFSFLSSIWCQDIPSVKPRWVTTEIHWSERKGGGEKPLTWLKLNSSEKMCWNCSFLCRLVCFCQVLWWKLFSLLFPDLLKFRNSRTLFQIGIEHRWQKVYLLRVLKQVWVVHTVVVVQFRATAVWGITYLS